MWQIDLKGFFLGLSPPIQGVFIKGRDIYDNILVAHEILNSFSKKRVKKGFMAIKLDMKKVHDKPNWQIHLEMFFGSWFLKEMIKLDYEIYHDH